VPPFWKPGYILDEFPMCLGEITCHARTDIEYPLVHALSLALEPCTGGSGGRWATAGAAVLRRRLLTSGGGGGDGFSIGHSDMTLSTPT